MEEKNNLRDFFLRENFWGDEKKNVGEEKRIFKEKKIFLEEENLFGEEVKNV